MVWCSVSDKVLEQKNSTYVEKFKLEENALLWETAQRSQIAKGTWELHNVSVSARENSCARSFDTLKLQYVSS